MTVTYLWKETAEMPTFGQLKGDRETDVLIIGGGIAGLLCAHMLQENGVDYILTEANAIGGGTSGGTTAVLTAQHGNIYTKLTGRYGKAVARGYLEANLQAVEKYRELAKKYDFDFREMDSYIYSPDQKRKLQVEAAVVRELGFPAEYTEETELPMKTAGAVRFPGMAQFHPLKLMAELSGDKDDIYQHTRIEKLHGDTAYFPQGSIKAKKTVIATHFPIINTRGLYPLKLYQKRSFVLALEDAWTLNGTYADIADGGIYMRNYGDLLIIGGGDCRTGSKADGFETVRRFAGRYFPEAKERYAWAAQDCMSLDEIPYIGKYSRTLDNVYVISGFNEWGMSSSMVAASIICDMIMGKENEFLKVFSPDRGIMTRQTVINAAETMVNFFNPGMKRCSHMGCALKKNQAENTWDCPCHGSRFDMEGHIMEAPAKKEINVNNL